MEKGKAISGMALLVLRMFPFSGLDNIIISIALIFLFSKKTDKNSFNDEIVWLKEIMCVLA